MRLRHHNCPTCGAHRRSFVELSVEECAELVRKRHRQSLVTTGSERGSFKRLAATLGIATTTLWKWETGKSMPPADAYRRWEIALGPYAHLLPK